MKPLQTVITVHEDARLKLENATLRWLSETQKVTIATLQLQNATKDQSEAQRKLEEVKKDVEKTYEIDLTSHTIKEDGTVVPRASLEGGDIQSFLRELRKQ